MGPLKKASFTLTADAAGEDTLERALPGRSPYLVYRIDIDDSAALGSGSASVADENAAGLAADDPTTYLFQTGEGVDTEYRGQFVVGPFTFDISGWDEDDVITFTVLYEAGGYRE